MPETDVTNSAEIGYHLGCICPKQSQVLATARKRGLSNNQRQCLDRISPCEHEEADTRLLLHASDVANQGMSRVIIRTADTDGVVLSITLYRQLKLDELCIGCGTGKRFRYIPISKMI